MSHGEFGIRYSNCTDFYDQSTILMVYNPVVVAPTSDTTMSMCSIAITTLTLVFLLRPSSACSWKVVDIPRIHADDISVQDFWDGTISDSPVIITGLAESWFRDTDFFHFLRDECASAAMPIMAKTENPKVWASLQGKGTMRMDNFIDYVLDESHKFDVHEKLYGFDLQISQECPVLLEQFKIPRFFNECVLQNEHVKGHFQKVRNNPAVFAWPTLMLGPEGSTSALHLDSQGFPFWMMLLEGRKHWRVLPYKANYHLTGAHPTREYHPPPYGYEFRGIIMEDYYGGGTFRFDGFDPDFKKYPKLCQAEVHEGILEKGEIIYVPNSAPHGVVNLEHTVAVTANFFNPLDRAHGEWMIKNCNAPDAAKKGFTSDVCDYMIHRVTHRRDYNGPETDLDFQTYMDEDYFAQDFDGEL
jgi:hypothetical protein